MKNTLISLFLLALPQAVYACTVCFGGDDTNLSRGFFWGIVVLGSLPFLLIGGFVGTLVYSARKKQPDEAPK